MPKCCGKEEVWIDFVVDGAGCRFGADIADRL
jgi:hypothetical protein